MSDEDRDVDIESDDEDLGSTASISGDTRNGGGSYSQADKRAHHNALERKRRDHIKDSFSGLRDSVPALHGEKASRAQILKKAAEYISVMRRKNTTAQADIDDLKRQNKVLEEQIRTLEKAKAAGITEFAGTSLLDTADRLSKIKTESISSFDGVSDSDSVSDVDGMANGSTGSSSNSSSGPRKRTVSGQGPAKRMKSPTTSDPMSAMTASTLTV